MKGKKMKKLLVKIMRKLGFVHIHEVYGVLPNCHFIKTDDFAAFTNDRELIIVVGDGTYKFDLPNLAEYIRKDQLLEAINKL